MDTTSFNLNRIYTLRNKNGDSFSVSSFNGLNSFVVFKQNDRTPSIKISVTLTVAIAVSKNLKQLLSSDAEQRLPIVIQKYNTTTKGYENSENITLVKDDKKCYSIELSSAQGTSATFEIRASTVISDGTNPMPMEQRSAMGVQEFITVLDKMLPVASIVSTYGAPKRGGNQQAGKAPARPNASSVTDPFGTDDIPF